MPRSFSLKHNKVAVNILPAVVEPSKVSLQLDTMRSWKLDRMIVNAAGPSGIVGVNLSDTEPILSSIRSTLSVLNDATALSCHSDH